MKEDARVRYTKSIIKKVFIELLKEQPVDKITVTNICDKASINRTTFYKYYKNASDLLYKIEADQIEILKNKIIEQNALSIVACLKVILTDIRENPDYYGTMFSENADAQFRKKLFLLIYEANMNNICKACPDLPQKEREWLFQFAFEGLNGILKQWMTEGMKEDVDQVVDFAVTIVEKIKRP